MAKKLIVDYSFTPSIKQIVIQGNIARERLILITNVTRNVVIYNFTEPSLGLSTDPVYDEENDTTVFNLVYNTASANHAADDKLQIFIEDVYTRFGPDDTFLDPVSKIRVSTPENLIDTDFEFGLQSTKWETLRLVNNIPSFYARNGEVPIIVSTVRISNGSKNVTVNTVGPHGLTVGTPIEINGLSRNNYEGSYVITSVPSTSQFIYKVPFNGNVSQTISTSYTAVIPGSFYNGASIGVSDIQTDNASPSVLTVNTKFPHGFAVGTEVFLSGSTASQVFTFNAGTSGIVTTTPDTLTTTKTASSSGSGENTSDYRFRPMVIDNFLNTNTKYAGSANISTTNSTITISSHGFAENRPVMYVSPVGNTSIGGLTSLSVLFAKSVTTNTFQLSNTAGGAAITLSSTGTTTNGNFRFSRVLQIESLGSGNSNTNINITGHGLTLNTPVVVVGSGNITIQGSTGQKTTSTVTAANIKVFFVEVVNSNRIRIKATSTGSAQTVTGLSGNVFIAPITLIAEANSFFIPSHGFSSDDFVQYQSSNVIGGLTNNEYYNIERTSGNLFKLKDKSTGSVIDLTTYGSGSHNFNITTTNPARDTIRIPANGFTANRVLTYDSGGNPVIGGLANSTNYFVKLGGPRPSANTAEFFRLSLNQNEYAISSINLAANATTFTVQFGSTADLSVFSPGQTVYIGAANNPYFNDVWTIATNGVNNSEKRLLLNTLAFKNTSVARTSTGGQLNSFVDLNQASTGNHKLSASADRLADDIYPIGSVGSTTSFTLVSGAQIPSITKTFSPSDPLIYNPGTEFVHWFKIPGHKYADATPLTYATGGDTAIGGLTNGQIYFAIVRDSDFISLASNQTNALNRVAMTLTTRPAGSAHSFTTASIGAYLPGAGTLSITDPASLVVQGTNTKFLSEFSSGDTLRFWNTGTSSPGTYFEFEIESVKADGFLKLKTFPAGKSVTGAGVAVDNLFTLPTITAATYVTPTRLYVKSDATAAHRPFDGGVTVYAGNIPDSQIIRQTRRYFRYQSGKGIQISLAVNFNPPVDVHRVTSSGTTATVVTKTAHFLKSGGSYQIQISDAEVPSGNNPYNGVFEVASITNDYVFTYNFITHRFTGNITNGSSTISNVIKTFNATVSTANLRELSGISSTNISSLQPGMEISGTNVLSGTKIKSVRNAAQKVILSKPLADTATSGTFTFTVENIFEFIREGNTVTGTGIPSNTTIESADASTNTLVLSANATATTANLAITQPSTAGSSIAYGFPKFNLDSWTDCAVRVGLFDSQNGMFYEYDGDNLYAVRRSSTQQLSGTVNVTNRSGRIVGDSDTRLQTQLDPGDMIVLRGQSYKVIQINSESELFVQPEYRGATLSNVIVSKTIDTKVPQTSWNIDKCDGRGIYGYDLNINKIQMAYMDYSWYGAGKIRFGFKDQNGEVKYVHQFLHNNKLTEAYFRSGNLPARYEVLTKAAPTFSPLLLHWGTSVIMDGRFDDDKAYLFTADSNTLGFTNAETTTFTQAAVASVGSITGSANSSVITYTNTGSSANYNTDYARVITGTTISGFGIRANTRIVSYTKTSSSVFTITLDQPLTTGISTFTAAANTTNASSAISGMSASSVASLRTGMGVTGTGIPAESRVGAVSSTGFTLVNTSGTAVNATSTGTGINLTFSPFAPSFTIGTSTGLASISANGVLPLVSFRLAPSVDNGITGNLGFRDIINRMQVNLKSAGVLSTHECEIRLFLNANLSNDNFQSIGSPSLSQLYKHQIGDSLQGGLQIFSFRAQGGGIVSGTKRAFATTTSNLSELTSLGNSIIGGDGVYPNGPDILTIAAVPVDLSQITFASPFQIQTRISWSESQA